MSPKRWTIAALALSLAGCHHGQPRLPRPATFADLCKEIEQDLGANANASISQVAKLDLRNPDDLSRAKSLLKPYGAAIDRAPLILTYAPESLMSEGPSAMPELKTMELTKDLAKLLCMKAECDCAGGQFESGFSDLKTATLIAIHFGKKESALFQAVLQTDLRLIDLRAMRYLTALTSLSREELQAIGDLAESLTPIPIFRSAIENEGLPSDIAEPMVGPSPRDRVSKQGDPKKIEELKLADASSKSAAQMFVKALGDEADPSAVLIRLNRLSPESERAARKLGKSDAKTVKGEALVLLQLMIDPWREGYEMGLEGTAFARMTTGFFRALEQKDRTGAFPESTPLQGRMAEDPFTGKPLAYHRTASGFQFACPGMSLLTNMPRDNPLVYPLPKP